MDPFRDFSADVEWVLETCEKRVSSYPPPLDRYCRDGLERRWLLKDSRGLHRIAYLIPFWLEQAFDLDHHTCRLIAVGNTFWLLYFSVQDQVMDSDPGESRGTRPVCRAAAAAGSAVPAYFSRPEGTTHRARQSQSQSGFRCYREHPGIAPL